jgi:tRNA 2-thiouridine synthesizing protein A
MLVRNKVRQMPAGAVLHVMATDPTTHRDFTQFCHFMGHELVRADLERDILEFWIRKAG